MDAWLGVEPRHLAALDAVRSTGSFRGAADYLGYVQSAVSQQILRLEALLGIRLVERTRGRPGVTLTDAGVQVAAYAGAILERLDATSADLRWLREARPMLHLGAFESVAARLLPVALARLADEVPDLRVDLHESVSGRDHFALVAAGELDVAFAELPLEPGPFAFEEVMCDPCVLVVRADSSLARHAGRPSLRDVAALPLLLHAGWVMTDLIEGMLRADGGELSVAVRSADESTLQAMASAGAGAAIMPRLAVDAEDPATAAIALDHLLPTRRIVLFWHTHRRRLEPVLGAMLDGLRAARGELSQPSIPRMEAIAT